MRYLLITALLFTACDDDDASTPARSGEAGQPDAAAGDAARDAEPDPSADEGPGDVPRSLDAGSDGPPPDAMDDAALATDADRPDGGPDIPHHEVDWAFDGPPPNIDLLDPACVDEGWAPGECVAGMGVHHDSRGNAHIRDDEPIEYELSPPSSGDHRARWGRWGEYSYMPPQRWLHNLEHGGVALLYHPCADEAVTDALREIARARPEDETGPFRWVMTPYVGLPSAVAVVAWEWTYTAECVRAEEIDAFIDLHYRMAREDVASDGRYDEGWIGR